MLLGVAGDFTASMAIEDSEKRLFVSKLCVSDCSVFHIKSPSLHFSHGEKLSIVFSRFEVDVLDWLVKICQALSHLKKLGTN